MRLGSNEIDTSRTELGANQRVDGFSIFTRRLKAVEVRTNVDLYARPSSFHSFIYLLLFHPFFIDYCFPDFRMTVKVICINTIDRRKSVFIFYFQND